MAAQAFLARIVPFGDPGMQVFRVTAIDPSLGMWPGPGGEHPPYPDIGLPGPQPPWPPKPGGGGPVDPGYSPPWAQILSLIHI